MSNFEFAGINEAGFAYDLNFRMGEKVGSMRISKMMDEKLEELCREDYLRVLRHGLSSTVNYMLNEGE